MFGPEPEEMGFVKNLFWGRVREELVFPYPTVSPEEKEKTDALVAELETYLKTEHPRVLIDAEQRIPEWVIQRLFEIGVLGMTIPEEYGGLGLGVASYNRVLETIGRYCGSTAVVVSAHQSIGCKALMLFGTEAQKKEFLPMVAREKLSAFALSEPQVGSDAAGQETTCYWDEEEQVYVLNGYKKWSTSGAIAGLYTVMAKHRYTDPKTGKERDGVTALIVTPDMEGAVVTESNRSKTGIRGTWQARFEFTNVKVPKERLLHKEGQGLKVALTCLNYGRCTLSAGVTGAAKQAAEQGTKWAATRYQFQRPLADFELVQKRIAEMHALCYAMDAALYMTCGFLDRHDPDIMVETAACKVFCSEQGWNVIDSAMQIMGGEGYVTENEFDRLWRDNRIHRIVEGSNEVMQSFIFAYGGKQLAEHMLGLLHAVEWDGEQTAGENLSRIASNALKPSTIKAGTPIAAELFLGKKVPKTDVSRVHPSLRSFADRLVSNARTHTMVFKKASKALEKEIVGRQAVQARLADNAILMFVWSCVLSKLDQQIASGANGAEWERDKAAGLHFMHMAQETIEENNRLVMRNSDDSMRRTAAAAIRWVETLPNEDYYIHESSPNAEGTGHPIQHAYVMQFPGDGEPYVPIDEALAAREESASGDGASVETSPAKA